VDDKQPEQTPGRDKDLNSPYGPQHGRVDEAAGGADSSPNEVNTPEKEAGAAWQPPVPGDARR
jgi:hypothetical protein